MNTKVEKFLYYSPMKTTGEWTYIMKWGGNTDRLHYYDVWVSGTETPKPIGDWTHVVFTWVSDDTQGTSSVKVYLNGTLCPQEGADAWTDTFYSLGINRLSFGGSNPYRAGGEGCIFHGALDNLYFFNDELDEDQVKFLYNQTESYATLPQETTTEAPDTSVTDTTKEEEDTSVADTSEETTPDAESSAANTTDNAADTTDNTAEKESPSVLPIVIAVIAVIVVAAVVIVLVKRKKS